MSLRKVAKELGITPAYLSMMVNGKRPWREDLKRRYEELVNSNGLSVNSERQVVEDARKAVHAELDVAGARGSRTHRPDRRAGANGFEVREAHRDPSAPAHAQTTARLRCSDPARDRPFPKAPQRQQAE